MNKRIITTSILLLFIFILASLIVYKFLNSDKNNPKDKTSKAIDTVMGAVEAREAAIIEARLWADDAKLSYIKSESDFFQGKSDSWIMIFSSEKHLGKGFQIRLIKNQIAYKEEIVFSGKGQDYLESPENAIARVRSLKGKENIDIKGVEAIYNEHENQWYWGIKTPSSTITVKAE